MGIFDFFRNRRARESAIPGTGVTTGSPAPDQVPSSVTEIKGLGDIGAPPPIDARPGSDDVPGVGDIGDLAALIQAALQQGNAIVSTEAGIMDLGAAGLRSGMFDALDLDGDLGAGGDGSGQG